MKRSDKKTIRKILLSLTENKEVELNSYTVFPPDKDGLIWITDPYGVDCTFYHSLSLESCSKILSRCNSTSYHDVYYGVAN